MPSKGSPDGPLYYSYEAGPVHVIILASFFTFTAGSDQYKFLQSDLAAIDRSKTPWVIALIHAPWYNSVSAPLRFRLRGAARTDPFSHPSR